MKILVCISKTPDTTAKISFKDNNTAFDNDGVSYIMNPYDEWYALVRGIELKEQSGGSVTALHVGPAANDIIIRKALATGADDAIRVDGEARDAHYVAVQIAAQASAGGYDYIFLGKETIEYNNAEVGAMVAELLDLPYFSFANNMVVENGKATISKEIEGGVEVLECEGPCVISAAKGLAAQRIPNMRGIMMAKRKPISVVEPIAVDRKTTIVGYELPEGKSGVKLVDANDMDELVRLLHEEAKVF